jgi:hypothetical protein
LTRSAASADGADEAASAAAMTSVDVFIELSLH